jgi:hypothetical protein
MYQSTTIPPSILSDTIQKGPYPHAEDRGPVFEVSPSADQPPAPLRTRVSATPRRRGFALSEYTSLLLNLLFCYESDIQYVGIVTTGKEVSQEDLYENPAPLQAPISLPSADTYQ